MISFFNWSQDLSYLAFDSDNGLPGNEVYDVLCDKNGMIWGATDGGVFQFDGNTFRLYTVQDGLSDNSVLKLYQDPSGRIWMVGHNGSLSYFFNNKITRLRCNTALQKKLYAGIIYSLKVTGNELKIGTNRGCFLIDLSKNIISEPVTDQFKNNDVYYEIETAKDVPEFVTTCKKEYAPTGLPDKFTFQFDGTFKVEMFTKEKEFQMSSVIQSAHRLSNDKYLFSIGNYMLLVSKEGILKALVYDNLVNSIAIIDNDIWVCVSDEGVYVYPDKNVYHAPRRFLMGHSISSIAIDEEDGTWFGTLGQGLFYCPNRHAISYLETEALNTMTLSLNGSDKGSIWCLTDKSVVIELQEGRINQVFGNQLKIDKGQILETQKGLVVASSISGLIDKKSGSRQEFEINDRPFYASHVCELENGNLLFLCYSQLLEYKGNQLVRQQLLPHRGQCLSYWNKRLLIGTVNGLYAQEGSQIVPYFAHLFKNIRINSITCNGDLVTIATATKGVFILNMSNGKSYHFSESTGMPFQSVNFAVLHKKSLWVATKKGLYEMEFDSFLLPKKVHKYDDSDGLPSSEIGSVFFYQDEIWITTRKGLCSISHPRHLRNKKQPDIRINSIFINNRPRGGALEGMKLSWDENSIQLQLSSNAMRPVDETRFLYKMEGMHSEYRTNKSGLLEFQNLSPGAYRLHIFGVNNQGLRSKELVYSFQIDQPLWKRWWFIALEILLIALIIHRLVKIRIHKITVKQQAEQALQQLIHDSRMQAIRAQMNPHFIFNAINSIQRYVLQNKSEEAYHYLTRFSQLIRNVLDHSKDDFRPLNEELAMLQLYVELEQLRFSQKFRYEVNLDETIDVNEVHFPVMLLQPLIENAIWHGLLPLQNEENLYILLEIGQNETHLHIRLYDNGAGLGNTVNSALHDSTSLGLQLVRDRLSLVDPNAALVLSNLQSTRGASVEFSIAKNKLISDEFTD